MLGRTAGKHRELQQPRWYTKRDMAIAEADAAIADAMDGRALPDTDCDGRDDLHRPVPVRNTRSHTVGFAASRAFGNSRWDVGSACWRRRRDAGIRRIGNSQQLRAKEDGPGALAPDPSK